MAEIIKTTFLLRRGLEAVWERNNPVLSCGEPGFVIDKNALKIGDGVTPWNELGYIGGNGSGSGQFLLGDNNSIIITNNEISIKGFVEAAPGAQLVKVADGSLAWIVPSITDEEIVEAVKKLEEEVYTKEEVDKLIAEAIEASNHVTFEEVEEIASEKAKEAIDATVENFVAKDEIADAVAHSRFEIVSYPEGAQIRMTEEEIRVLCPKDTNWTKQQVGPTGNSNMYYMGFRAYAPKEAVGFKEGDQGVIIDEYFDFSGDFAGTDEYGRNYSICWLALASYNAATDTWNYFGKNSTTKKYIGWTYVVEWYDATGKVIHSDTIRINLSNEDCHNIVEPYYMGAINVNKLTQNKDEFLVLYGGSASDNI